MLYEQKTASVVLIICGVIFPTILIVLPVVLADPLFLLNPFEIASGFYLFFYLHSLIIQLIFITAPSLIPIFILISFLDNISSNEGLKNTFIMNFESIMASILPLIVIYTLLFITLSEIESDGLVMLIYFLYTPIIASLSIPVDYFIGKIINIILRGNLME